MRKLLLIGFFFLTACLSPYRTQRALPELTSTPEATATRIIPTSVPVSSPQGATSAPSSSTPPPTRTTTPIPPERYFTEEFHTAPAYWSILYSSGTSNRVEVLNEDDFLTFALYDQNIWMYAIYGAFEYEYVIIETQVESRDSDVTTTGLVCHYDEQNGWYEFNISSDGTYNVLYGEWLAENIARYTPILNDDSERIETGNATNQIGLECYENTVQLYINDKPIRKLNVAHIGLTGGKVGLSLASFEEAPVVLSFDWVKVREP